jgi:hypothetical protein
MADHGARVLAAVSAAAFAALLLTGCGAQQVTQPGSTSSSSTATSTATASSTTTAADSSSTAGATGHIHIVAMRGPTCPVERAGAPPCVAPYVGSLQVVGTSGAVITTVTTSADGTADLSLPAGIYTVTAPAPSSALPRLIQPVTVSVTAGNTVTANLSFDTGIR